MTVEPLPVDPRLEPLFHPRSIAVVGASSRPERVGARVLRFLVDGGYDGTLLPVNPRVTELHGLPCHPSIAALPEVPDLAVIAVDAAHTTEAVRELAARGGRTAICMAAGFRESGPAGAALEAELADAARETGVTLMGPNSAGVRHPARGLFATFATDVALGALPGPGSVAVVSQSGGLAGYLGAAVTKARGIGYRWVVDPGNEADVDVADCLAMMAHDPGVSVIGLITEGFADGNRVRRALATAQEQGTPVVALKIGTSEAGARAAASHTGALAGSDEVYDAVFRQHGVLRARDEHEFLAALRCYDAGCVPQGRGVAVFSLSGGVATLLTDLCVERDLDVPPLPPPPDPTAAEALPAARFDNPLDLTGQIGSRPDLLEAVLDHVLGRAEVHSAVLGFAYMLQAKHISDVFVPAIVRVGAAHGKPLIITGLANAEAEKELRTAGIPVEPLAIDAVDAIAAAAPARVGAATHHEPARPPDNPTRAVVVETGPAAAGRLPGIPFVESRTVSDDDEARAAAGALGWPVVAKLEGTGDAHKTEHGLVRAGLADPVALTEAYRDLAAIRDRNGVGDVVVQPMLDGVETVLGLSDDPTFGPVVMVGLGGVFVETLGDVAFGLPPIDRDQAARMIRSLKGFPLLDGARGRPTACVDDLVDAVVALSDAALDHRGRLLEADVNPFLVSSVPGRSAAVDVLLTWVDSTGAEGEGR
ncbi:acetate--CoA ligase family protein [Actinomycetospora endophytica]|uniref:Acetate--CoA ligase family protein n=1 Tax=Actinomycetospora endophytica TaxID=2291215 RepID=A0ABS8PBR8_9PSEU|nr:acetate--CoA ligase family protein [Actinomycetospora endophytica]MCD2195337.1 acetate--CoA ligase family protein [Actinomycetospora endophytica]